MQVSLFGATGKTGTLVLDEALRRGWRVQALVRDATKLAAREGLHCIQGDARSAAAVAATLSGSTAVLCCLGMHDIALPATDFSDSVRCIVAGMHRLGLRRLLAIGSAGVLDHPDGGLRNQQGVPAALAHIAAEHVRNCETLRISGLDWTLMCPLLLQPDIPVGHARYLFEDLPPGSHETGYADLAATMVALVQDPRAHGQRVGIVSLR